MKLTTLIPIILSTLLFLVVSADAQNLDIVGHGTHIKVLSNDLSKNNAFEFSYNNTNVSLVPKSIYLQSSPQNDIKSSSVVSQEIGDTFIMDEIFGVNTSYSLTQENGYVKEELTLLSNLYPLASDSDIFVFKHRFNYSGLTPYINGIIWDENSTSTSEKILFKSGDETIFSFLEPYAIDNAGTNIQLTYGISKNKQTGEINIKLNVPMSFLNHAVYPVIIDPSLEQSGGSVTLDGNKNYDYVNLTNGAILYISAYGGTGTTGTLNLTIAYDLNIDATSSINGNSRGLTGGSSVGVGVGGNGGTGYGAGTAGTAGTSSLGSGGGGGASYATSGGSGGAGGANVGQGSAGGSAGTSYGTTNQQNIQMGSGGGGGGGASPCSSGGSSATGGAGGAALIINAGNIYVTGLISMTGGAGGAGGSCYTSSANGGGGGGGASGGGILLNATNINLNSATITTAGGTGGAGGEGATAARNGYAGNSGGAGRYKAFYKTSYTAPGTLTTGSTYTEQTNSAPTVPVLTTHANYHNLASTTLTWTASTDANGDTLTYDVKVGTSSGATNILNYAGDTDTTSNSFTMTPQNGYFWSVRACDPYTCSSWATESSFSFTNSAPSVPVLTSHSNFHLLTSTTVNFTASTDSDGDSIFYDIKLYNTSTGLLLINQSNTSNNFSNSFMPAVWTSYNFTARSRDIYTQSAWATAQNFSFTNSIPIIQNVSIIPANATSTSNLTFSINVTDSNGDTLTNHTLWYKNGVLNTTWNDSLILYYMNNFTTSDSIYVVGYSNDTFNNSITSQSNTVIIGSGNSAPSISSITLIPNIRKYNKTVYVNSSTITDAESSYVKIRTYYKLANDSKIFLVNSSWSAPPTFFNLSFNNPWNDSNAHTIYTQVEDSGNALGTNNLTSSELQTTLTGDTTPPTVASSSLSSSSIYTGSFVTISMNTSLSNGTTSNVSVIVSRPDATSGTFVMTTTDNTTWTYIYTTTSDVGSYFVETFCATDDSGNAGCYSSALTFVASTAPAGSTGGGGGGGSTVVIVQSDNGSTSVLFTNITSIESLKDLTKLGECFTSGLMLSNKCAQGSVSIVDEVTNWWTMFGAYIGSLTVLFILALKNDEKKKFAENVLFYGTISWVSIILLTFMGLNLYVFNYAFNSPLPGFMFLSFTMWGGIATVVGDSYSKRKR